MARHIVDDVAPGVKPQRLQQALGDFRTAAANVHALHVGQEMLVMLEGVGRKNQGLCHVQHADVAYSTRAERGGPSSRALVVARGRSPPVDVSVQP